jgi:hypothetical protein
VRALQRCGIGGATLAAKWLEFVEDRCELRDYGAHGPEYHVCFPKSQSRCFAIMADPNEIAASA